MKKLWNLFITKEKILIFLLIFILLNITMYISYKQSIYSYPLYQESYPQAGLNVYYYFHCIGTNVYLFMIMMLLLPNIVSYDFLNIHQNHFAYMIETRINKKQYYRQAFWINALFTFGIVFIIEILIILIIHFFYIPLQFNAFSYPDEYYIKAQILSSNEILSLGSFVLLTSLGYAIVSSLLFTLQIVISNKYIYRCFGVILGILLVVVPALIQNFLLVPESAFILQINNLVALGMENVRANPFGLSHLCLYIIAAILYILATFVLYRFLLKGRAHHD